MSTTRFRVPTPVGALAGVVHDGALCALGFEDRFAGLAKAMARRFGADPLAEATDPAGVVGTLRAYLAGDLAALDRVRVDLQGTPFQKRVWEALRRIPAGTTISYAELAERVGHPRAVRAVAQANARNPVSVVVPCHRVIAKDGTLHGYGGGLDRKRWLLTHEGGLRAGEPGAPARQPPLL